MLVCVCIGEEGGPGVEASDIFNVHCTIQEGQTASSDIVMSECDVVGHCVDGVWERFNLLRSLWCEFSAFLTWTVWLDGGIFMLARAANTFNPSCLTHMIAGRVSDSHDMVLRR